MEFIGHFVKRLHKVATAQWSSRLSVCPFSVSASPARTVTVAYPDHLEWGGRRGYTLGKSPGHHRANQVGETRPSRLTLTDN